MINKVVPTIQPNKERGQCPCTGGLCGFSLGLVALGRGGDALGSLDFFVNRLRGKISEVLHS
ncbi:hypothetical protein BRARA_B00080 [Brassica rapa]|uniref:Uncharacterized protein n=1 Tax=Brassica campestris TaxID=3711 RepID=A0A398A519_BRACM|nr:hypothetical protein BRARA_B00080 [Brassica rapa]